MMPASMTTSEVLTKVKENLPTYQTKNCLYQGGDVTDCPGPAQLSVIMHASITTSEVPTKVKQKVSHISEKKTVFMKGVMSPLPWSQAAISDLAHEYEEVQGK